MSLFISQANAAILERKVNSQVISLVAETIVIVLSLSLSLLLLLLLR